ncbi:YggS family pyridoxal phosphate-dependent enzyme [Capnocytophaga canimorsus]|uniref:YggS family pyridoxal phosphate-dependent enzyme n=1 Tax=Capnocytophaga canimorsus TaxID=28188 RepID=UPI000D6DCC61|nr:YggS family pyridoxal phosphate-dependent enzyme [Capnocytophaga canimorsus]AWL79494.1 YggS family pyridoxal phosphate-dependent enzyme [Capnocytophaga canimorsus]AYW37963.1 YggS family pyridoxal phosphate-dependent enzyme [Capnocytophaga canimorsus]MDT9499344.1 YggS family pyridoxal phosphate-dependent enzyme [Capnocytophaga canimorsus]
MSITENLKQLKNTLPKHVILVAVSKFKPIADLQVAYQAGQRVFGESKIQEMTQKQEALPKDIQWHMIGHVQRNKVKYMAPYVSLIHGVDRLRLLEEIDKQALKNNRVINCLLQVHIAQEETKFGFNPQEIFDLITNPSFSNLKNIKIKGLMGMASFTSDETQIKKEFQLLKHCYDRLKTKEHPLLSIEFLSMGMSDDYPIALACGSNMIRVGSKIFGNRG